MQSRPLKVKIVKRNNPIEMKYISVPENSTFPDAGYLDRQ